MGIKVKNVQNDSCLHKYYLPLSVIGNSQGLISPLASGSIYANAVCPVEASLEELVVITDTALTATSGYSIKLTNGYGSATFLNNATYNNGTNAWAADTPISFTPTADLEISAMTPIEFLFSGTQGSCKLSVVAVFDINSNRQK